MVDGRLSGAAMMTPLGVRIVSPGSRELAVAARLAGEVHDHRAGPHRLDGGAGDQLGRRAAGDERRGDDHVGARRGLGEQLGLLGLLLRGELASVPARRLGVGRALDLEELRAQGLHLLLDRGADVEGGDLRAEAPRGGDGLQAGHTRAQHEHLGGRDGPGRGHQHREEAAELVGGEQRRAVAADVGLR